MRWSTLGMAGLGAEQLPLLQWKETFVVASLITMSPGCLPLEADLQWSSLTCRENVSASTERSKTDGGILWAFWCRCRFHLHVPEPVFEQGMFLLRQPCHAQLVRSTRMLWIMCPQQGFSHLDSFKHLAQKDSATLTTCNKLLLISSKRQH